MRNGHRFENGQGLRVPSPPCQNLRDVPIRHPDVKKTKDRSRSVPGSLLSGDLEKTAVDRLYILKPGVFWTGKDNRCSRSQKKQPTNSQKPFPRRISPANRSESFSMVLAEADRIWGWLWMSQKKVMSAMKQVSYRLFSGLQWSGRPKPTDPSSLIMGRMFLGGVSESHSQRRRRADAVVFAVLTGNWMKTNQIGKP